MRSEFAIINPLYMTGASRPELAYRPTGAYCDGVGERRKQKRTCTCDTKLEIYDEFVKFVTAKTSARS
jgi:hypothetical protein